MSCYSNELSSDKQICEVVCMCSMFLCEPDYSMFWGDYNTSQHQDNLNIKFINKPCCDFCSFLENLESRSKGYGSPGPANGQSPSSGSQSPIVPPSGASTGSSSPSTPQPPIPSQVLPQSPSVSASSPPPPLAVVSVAASSSVESKPSAQSPEHLQSSAASGSLAPQKRSFISRWFGSPPASEATAIQSGEILHITQAVKDSARGHMPSSS